MRAKNFMIFGLFVPKEMHGIFLLKFYTHIKNHIQNLTAFISFLCLFVAPSNALTSFDLHNINAAHAQGYTGKGVNVGIVDTIFNPNHELLQGKFLQEPINNFVGNPDDRDHGNHVAGILAGATTNKESYGVAYEAKILGYGNFGVDASYRSIDFSKMLEYNVRVINNSHTGFHQRFADFAKNYNILVVYAAGNNSGLSPIDAASHGIGSSGTNANLYNLSAWLAVGNIDPSYVTRQNDGSLSVAARAVGGSASTNLCGNARGYCLMAAGTKIVSAYPYTSNNGYGPMTGTSMAAPLVSGVAAILAQKFPFLTNKQLADIILSTANNDFVAPKMIYKNEEIKNSNGTTTIKTHIIYIGENKIPKLNGKTDTAQVLKDLQEAYGVTITTRVDTTTATYYEMTKEQVFGQGIVDAAAALKGLAVIDANRLSNLDVDDSIVTGKKYIYYTLDTKEHNAVFENDIRQKKWSKEYQNANSQLLLEAEMSPLDAGLLKKGSGTLSLGGHLLYKGATVVQEGELRLINGTRTAVQTLNENQQQALNESSQSQTQSLNESLQIQGLSQSSQTQNLNENSQILSQNSAKIQNLSENSQILGENSALSSQNSAMQANALSQNLPKPSSTPLSTQSVPLSVAGEVLVQPNGTLSVDTDTNIAKSLENQGVLNVGLSSPSLLSVSESYTQKAGATLRLGFLVDKAANSALKAASYNIESGTTLIYKPLSASVASRKVEFNLQGMEKSLANFSQISLDTSGYALKYTLLDDNKTLIIAANGNAYANFNGANESLAAVLRAMSEADISSDYTAFFTSLNSAELESYRQTLQSLDNTSHLRSQELILLNQSKNTLEAVLNLQGDEGYFMKPSYMSLSGANSKANRLGTQLYANKATYFGGILGFLSYDKLASDDDISSHALALGFGVKNALDTRKSVGLFGGLSVGGATNSVQKASQTLNFSTLFLSAYAGLDKNFALNGTNIAPTAFVSYHLMRNGDIKDDGIEFNGSKLFAKSVTPANLHFLSANLGVNLRQDLSKALNAGLYGFYERRILGSELENEAEFDDFAGKFTQKIPLSVNLMRFGLDFGYETPKAKTQFVLVKRGYKFQRVKKKPANTYFVRLGLEGELGLDNEYKGFGANLKGGVRF